MPKISRFSGIMCVGENHNQAVENFRKTALGENVMIYASKDGVGYASQSSADLYNPAGSNELLEECPDMVEKATFASESTAGDVKAHYTICLDGCGSHIVSDSSANIQGACPSCSADLSEITDERVRDFLAESAAADENHEHEGLVATGSTLEKATQKYAQALSSSSVFTALSSVGGFTAANKARFNPYNQMKVESCERAEGSDSILALSSVAEDDIVEAHVFSCSANCAQPFTVSSDANPVFCAHCSAGLLDEEAEDDVESQSSDDSDIDILDEDDLDDEDEDDNEDDEDIESDSSVDEDDDIDSLSSDDEDDLDEDDLDEDDLDEDDFDEDDIDDEDDLDEDDIDEDFDEEDEEEVESDSSVLSTSGDDEDDFDDDEDDLEEEDLDIDEDEDDFDSESGVVSRTFDSLSTAQEQHGTLDPTQASLSRGVGGKVDAVHLFYDGTPIARATFASVSNAVGEEVATRTFQTDQFIRAVSSSLLSNGVVDTCSAFGFMPFQIEMPVEALLASQSDARVTETTESVSATINDAIESRQDRLVAALSAAQLGLTKNFWGDARNPIVESLCSSLAAAGVRDARGLVQRAFIAHGKDFLSVSLTKALDLMAKSEVAQDEIAQSIEAAAGHTTEAKVEQPVVQQQQAVTAPAPRTPAAELLATDTPVQSQSSASTGSFDDKLARLRSSF